MNACFNAQISLVSVGHHEEAMYLEKLTLENFRSFEHAEIPLCRDLTILVGENNGGKSNAIDAIRLRCPDERAPRQADVAHARGGNQSGDRKRTRLNSSH